MTLGTPALWAGSANHPVRVLRHAPATFLNVPVISHANSATATTRGGGYGVAGAGDLLVTTTGTLGYSIAAGHFALPGTFATAQGTYVGYNDAAVTGTLPARDAANPYIAYICVRVRDTDEDATGAEITDISVVQGTPAASPAAPAVPSSLGSLLILSEVLVPSVANGGAVVFTDRRFWLSAVGGIQPVRSSQHPTGAAKQLAGALYEVDTTVMRVWDGTAFRRVMPRSYLAGTTLPSTERHGDLMIEGGSYAQTTDVAGDVLVGFQSIFLATPTVVVCNGEVGSATTVQLGGTLNAGGFTARFRDYAGNPVVTTAVRVNYIAIGYAPTVTT